MSRTLLLWPLVALTVFAPFVVWLVFFPERAEPRGPLSRQRLAPGPFAVMKEPFTAIDRSRPTPPNRGFPGSHERQLKGSLWRPAALDQPGPLLVYSHGFMSFHSEGVYLAEHLASHGYTVVAVDFPLTSLLSPGGPQVEDVVNQPGDISFLIDTLLARSRDVSDSLFATIDAERIAAAGLSLGGLTTMLVAFHGKLLDRRIKAAVAIASPASMFNASFFATNNTLPLLLVAGDIDAMVPYASIAAIRKFYPSSTLVRLRGGNHANFAAIVAGPMRYLDNMDNLGCLALLLGLSDMPRTFMSELSGVAYGVHLTNITLPCQNKRPAKAMRASYQQMLTTLAVHAFLDSHLATSTVAQNEAARFLETRLAAEYPEAVQVEFGQRGTCCAPHSTD